MTGLAPAEAPLPVLQGGGGLLLSLHEEKGPSSANSLISTYLPPYMSIVVTFLLTCQKVSFGRKVLFGLSSRIHLFSSNVDGGDPNLGHQAWVASSFLLSHLLSPQ